ncbi:MAG: hypothetical protein CW338_10965 [Clostridiales bacterium]|nr:hypothetical protein [Clostridiales bacterium]
MRDVRINPRAAFQMTLRRPETAELFPKIVCPAGSTGTFAAGDGGTVIYMKKVFFPSLSAV